MKCQIVNHAVFSYSVSFHIFLPYVKMCTSIATSRANDTNTFGVVRIEKEIIDRHEIAIDKR